MGTSNFRTVGRRTSRLIAQVLSKQMQIFIPTNSTLSSFINSVDLALCAKLGGVTLSPEVSAIYLSMKNSNLECIDENNQDHMSADTRQEDEDAEEYDDFDPYFFIKNLPDLSSVVPTFRPLLLPKQTRSCPSTSLVLDLDGKYAA